MLDIECDLQQVHLQPGEVYIAHEPTIIQTILGSCVGVTFWSARLGVGALCHALLPRHPKKRGSGWDLLDGYRYVDFAIRDLATQFDRIGAARGELEIKLFGGADVLQVSPSSTRPTVGKQNCEVAIEVSREEGLGVLASSLGGTLGRSIRFHTGTGEVQLRWLTRAMFEESIDK